MLAAIGLAGCGSDDASSDACAASSASLSLDKKAVVSVAYLGTKPQALYSFDGAGLTAPKEFKFVIRNNANVDAGRPLTIEAVQIVESGDGAVEKPAFECLVDGKPCADATIPAIIPDGFTSECMPKGAINSVTVSVRYDGAGITSVRKALLRIRFDGDPDYKTAPFDVRFETTAGDARIQCSQTVVDFGHIDKGKSATESFECRNVGTAPLRITKAELFSKTDPPLSVGIGDWVVTLAQGFPGTPELIIGPGKPLSMAATLTSVPGDEAIGATLHIYSTDQSKEYVAIQLLANSSGPCFKPDPASLDFGEVTVGGTGQREVQIKGCGSEPAILETIAMDTGSHADFSIDFTGATGGPPPSKTKPLTIQPNASQAITVLCKPTTLGAVRTGRVRMVSQDGTERFVPVTCTPAELSKPTACWTAHPGTTVIPQTELTLSAACSKAAPGHSIAKYKWKVVEQPPGSFANFKTGDSGKEAKFEPNVASNKTTPYHFSLQVTDEAGTQSDPVAIKIDVLPDNKLHVELTWNTPGDANKTDDKGADMDLHLAHPVATGVAGQTDLDGDGQPDPWFAAGCDCFWLTCSGQGPQGGWGDTADIHDNPKVDLDDTDGWGPENLSIKYPQQTLSGADVWYWIGAHAFNNLAYGPSTPKVRVYLDGVEVFNKTGPPLDTGDMWCAGQVRWDGTGQSTDVRPCFASGKGSEVTKKYPFKQPTPWTCDAAVF